MFRTITTILALLIVATAAKTRWHELESKGYDFKQYLTEFQKEYSPNEYAMREKIFNENLQRIKQHNKNPHATWKNGVNHLTDSTPQELGALRGYRRATEKTAAMLSVTPKVHPLFPGPKQAPVSVDWRTTGAVSAIKDQGRCGSCWAFASAETIESFWFLKTQKLMDLSPQQIASCTEIPPQCYNQGTGGCEGSSQVVAFSAIIANGGIVSEWTYPYQSWPGTDFACKWANNKTVAPVVRLTSYTVITPNSYDALLDALATQGPVTVSVDASTWSSYESGIYDGCNQTNPSIDHAVQAVGYGVDSNGRPYWIVRNSWTPNWGENGYIRLYRDGADNSAPRCGNDPGAADCDGAPTSPTVCGTCGILYDNAYPVIAD